MNSRRFKPMVMTERPVRRAGDNGRHGYTLLEMLVATGVLAVLVALLFQMFAGASNAWRTGERIADVNQELRVPLDLMQREVSQAIVDDRTPQQKKFPGLRVTVHTTAPDIYGRYTDGIRFVLPTELQNDPGGNHAEGGNYDGNNPSPPKYNNNEGYRSCAGVNYYSDFGYCTDNGSDKQVCFHITRQVHTSGAWLNTSGIAPLMRGSVGLWDNGYYLYFNKDWGGFDASKVGQGMGALSFRNYTCLAQDVYSFICRPLLWQNGVLVEETKTGDIPIDDWKTYGGVLIGVGAVDKTTAAKIWSAKITYGTAWSQFVKPLIVKTNWTTVHFANYITP